MIELVVDNKKHCFNLKNRDREKSLFNAWYAMSDMPSHSQKKLRITTDRDETLEYKICEIQDCLFIDQEYIDEAKTVEKPKEQHSKDISEENMTIEEIYDRYLPSDSDFSKVVKTLYCKLFQRIPRKKLIRIFKFSHDLRVLGYNIDIQDLGVQKIVEEMLEDSDDVDVTPYVNRVIEYLQRKKYC